MHKDEKKINECGERFVSEKARTSGLWKPDCVTKGEQVQEEKGPSVVLRWRETKGTKNSCSSRRDYQSERRPRLTQSSVVSDTEHNGRLRKTTSCLSDKHQNRRRETKMHW